MTLLDTKLHMRSLSYREGCDRFNDVEYEAMRKAADCADVCKQIIELCEAKTQEAEEYYKSTSGQWRPIVLVDGESVFAQQILKLLKEKELYDKQ